MSIPVIDAFRKQKYGYFIDLYQSEKEFVIAVDLQGDITGTRLGSGMLRKDRTTGFKVEHNYLWLDFNGDSVIVGSFGKNRLDNEFIAFMNEWLEEVNRFYKKKVVSK